MVSSDMLRNSVHRKVQGALVAFGCEKCSGNLWSEQQRLFLVVRSVTWLTLVFGLCCYTIHYLNSSVKGMISSGEHL